MATEVKLPRLGQGMESGTIVKWLKGEGEPVKKREPLYELDTDKVTQEVEAEADGVLLKIVVDSGEVEVGRTIAFIGSEGEDVPSGNGAAPADRGRIGRGGGRGGGRAADRGQLGSRHGRPACARPGGCRRDRRGRDCRRRRRSSAPRRPRQGFTARAQARAREGDRHRHPERQRPRGPDRRRGRRARRRRRAEGRSGSNRRSFRRGRGDRADLDAQDDRAPLDRSLAGAGLPADGLGRHDPVARAARAARRAPARGRDEADRQRPADEGGRGRAAAPPGCERPLHGRQDPALPVRARRHRGRGAERARRPRDPRRRPEDDPGDRRRPRRPSSAAPATASSSATTSRTARSRSRTSACSGSSSSSQC